jgi:polyisoprenoid-binding protein YceI
MKPKWILLLASSFLILALAGCGLLRPPEEASGTLEVIPLEQPTETTPEQNTAPAEVAEATPTQVVETQVESPTAPAVEEGAGGILIYQILPGSSQVRFELDEDLRGNRITVVGTTDQVAGELALNFSDLASTQVGTFQINARTLLTDNSFRNRAIQNEILDTGSYEFVTFTPTAINGLPESAAPGTEVTFTIDGNLTIRSITQPVTFTITAQAISDTEIRGTAHTTIQRADFELNIPSVRDVANVEEEVELYIDFVAASG